MSERAASLGVASRRVCVLLATCNGLPWLDTQIDSILGQTGVEVEVLASDDGSSDGTRERLQKRVEDDARVKLLPAASRRFGSAAANFYHLIQHAETQPHALFAFADQDDVWHDDKLLRHARLLEREGADGVSSDVLAFWPSGRSKLIRKSQPQRRFDHLFEPPGPGCSFLMRAELVRRCAALLRALAAAGIMPLPKHDWFVYLAARRFGGRWHIDDRPSLDYRQHAGNEVGANVGLRAVLRRMAALSRGEYRDLVERALALALFIDGLQGREAAALRVSTLDILRDGRRRRIDALMAALFMPRGVGVV